MFDRFIIDHRMVVVVDLKQQILMHFRTTEKIVLHLYDL